ncbi:MAG TPA: carotenoid oxygenase family protein, partial [Ktedonobacteraceae bacterium]|nr:carotenoid oxygenase family protein [Ktedonobacteraceae bacterium]
MAGQFMRGLTTQSQEIVLNSLPVEGKVPLWLAGNLLRNGPAKFEVGEQKYRHWFDGQAMLHSFTFQQGNVTYTNKFLRSSTYLKGQATGKIAYQEFATDPCRSIFKRIASIFNPLEPGGNANVNISKIGKSFVALTELPLPVEFDPRTLETLGVIQHQDKVAGQHCTPHPHYDVPRKMGVNSITHFSARSSYNIYGIRDGETKRTRIGSIPVKEPGYIHSFAMTEHYIILVEFPIVVNPLSMLLSGKPFIENFHWKPERGTRFFVMRKDDGQIVQTYQSEACFAFHHINAFETENSVIVDIATMTDASVIDVFYLNNMHKEHVSIPWPSFTRYTLPLQHSSLSAEVLTNEAIELPRINYEHSNGRNYQYAYGVGVNRQARDDFLNQLVKVDT